MKSSQINSNLYFFFNYHNLEILMSAYIEDNNPKKLVLCEKELAPFLKVTLNLNDESIRTVNGRLSTNGWYFLLKLLIAKYLRKRIPVGTVVLMNYTGRQSVWLLLRYTATTIRYVWNPSVGDFHSLSSTKVGVKQEFLRKISSRLTGIDLSFSIYGNSHIDFDIPKALCNYEPPRKVCPLKPSYAHHDCVLLELWEPLENVNLPATRAKISSFLKQFSSIAYKPHPGAFYDHRNAYMESILSDLKGRIWRVPRHLPAEVLAHPDALVVYDEPSACLPRFSRSYQIKNLYVYNLDL